MGEGGDLPGNVLEDVNIQMKKNCSVLLNTYYLERLSDSVEVVCLVAVL